ncbi:hypothetical protein BUALT_Bualt06G0103200 [Buddleja alternifolia]|uniref:Protein REVEILLE 6-like n=1 Tax=Buddleja alternifolia TaxID=168488 RepID=A0AAV6XKV6_9LAMI|nr:hypothetical protein BUALT_Bualt06G0103200 [Buddleja alternifolia]
MVSLNTNQPEGFYLDTTGMALPNLGSFSSPAAGNLNSPLDDPNKKIRKPYTITKSRESWTEPEHDKFLEALQLFDRDWKKIEAFVGSKTVIQIRSHAQKYFLKVQKSGANEHLPPPRPKRKAAHPYPQKASKIFSQEIPSFQAPPAVPDPGFVRRSDSSALPRHHDTAAALPSWTDKSVHNTSFSHVTKGDSRSAGQSLANSYSSGRNESAPRTRATGEITKQMILGTANGRKPDLSKSDGGMTTPEYVECRCAMLTYMWCQYCLICNLLLLLMPSLIILYFFLSAVLPDFAQVYGFIGSVFDPNVTGHLQNLKKMEPIDIETVLLLMRNLSINLASPDFEDHRRLLSSYEIDPEKDNAVDVTDPILGCQSDAAA